MFVLGRSFTKLTDESVESVGSDRDDDVRRVLAGAAVRKNRNRSEYRHQAERDSSNDVPAIISRHPVIPIDSPFLDRNDTWPVSPGKPPRLYPISLPVSPGNGLRRETGGDQRKQDFLPAAAFGLATPIQCIQ